MAGGYRGGKDRAATRDYLVRAFSLPEQLFPTVDELALAAGRHYTGAVVEFWRVVRRKGIWLSEGALSQIVNAEERWESDLLHSQSRQQTMHAFFDALSTWRTNTKDDPAARPPHKLKRFFTLTWIQNGIRVRDARSALVLLLSFGKDGNRLRLPLEIPLPSHLASFGAPSKVEIGWKKAAAKGGYEVRCTYTRPMPEPTGDRPVRVAAADLGEVHPFVICDGERSIVYNGGELRAKRRYRNMTQGQLQEMISRTKAGSRRRRRLVRSKRMQLGTVDRQIRDIEHKQTRRAVTDVEEAGVTDLVIGDLRTIRKDNPSRTNATAERPSKGRVQNQRLHQAPLGRMRAYLTYKARRAGIRVPDLQDEAFTTKTCPTPGCGARNGPTNRCYRCKRCGLIAHRDSVGAWNIRAKYLGIDPWGNTPAGPSRVVGAVAAPTGVRYRSHMRAGPAESGVAAPEA